VGKGGKSRFLSLLCRPPRLRWLLTLGASLTLLISGSVSTVSAGIIAYPGQPPHDPLASKARYLVLLVLDGARPDYFRLAPLPHIQALIAGGTDYTQAYAGILESETPTGHATISTGSTPKRSGILGFSWEQGQKNFSLFNPTVVRSGVMEQIMQAAHAPTIAGLYKARFPTAQVAAISGYKYYAVDPLGGPQADFIEYFRGTLQKTFAPTAIPGHVPPVSVFNDPALTANLNKLALGQDDSMATQLALDTFAAVRQRITLVNYPDFDWPLGHVDGGILSPARARALMTILDNDLGRIEDAYRRAGVLKKTIFVITADHGMAPITRFIPDSIFNDAVKKAGTTAPSMTHNTATYIWLQNPARARAVAANIIAAHDRGIQSVYYLAAGKKPGYVPAPGSSISPAVDRANRHLLATLLNGHQPDVVALTRKGQTTSPPGTHWRADHGGASWGVQHIPLIIAGPGIRQGLVSNQPAQLEDIAPTVLTAMDVPPTGMEGHVLTEALDAPNAADVQRRATEITRATPLVQALIVEDAAESRR
jgi:hypothetical protein